MKELLALVAILLAIISYFFYFRDIFVGKTKPHAFTSFIWGVMTAIAFFAQLSDNGGAGVWVTGFTALACFAIAGAGLKVGRQNIVPIDWLFLIGALASLGLWAISKDPVTSVILITVIDALAFIPTFRKSYHKPHQETVITYALSSVKFVLAIIALNTFTVVTVLYPLSLVVTNALFVGLLVIRRYQLGTFPESKTA